MTKIDKINQTIGDIQKEGYTYLTEYKYLQQSYARLIIPTGQKNAGHIRSMEEANKALMDRFGEKAILFTKETYQKELSSLSKQIGGFSKESFYKELRSDVVDTVERMNDALGTNYYTGNKSTKELYDAIKSANTASRADSKGSPSFYEHLAEILGVTE